MKKASIYLYSLIKKRINLADFLETEIGCNLQWVEKDISAKSICPIPSHRDSKPSFHINYYPDSGVWVYHCFGCGAKGTIIDFCEEYYDLKDSNEAVLWICNKFGFKESKDLVIDGLQNVKKTINMQRKLEYVNMVNSNFCHLLLRKDFKKYNRWVGQIYRKMNKALEQEDLETLEVIRDEVSDKMRGE